MGLTRPEDSLLWAWLAIVAGYAIVGIALGYRGARAPPAHDETRSAGSCTAPDLRLGSRPSGP